MDGFIFFVFVIFFIFPFLSKAFGGKKKAKTKQWGQTHAQLRAKQDQIREMQQRLQNKHGHSAAKRNTHNRLHSNDSSSVFPESHQARVRVRDQRDRVKNAKIEENLHSRQNFGIGRAKNKSRHDWGTRNEVGVFSFRGIITVLGFALIVYIVVG